MGRSEITRPISARALMTLIPVIALTCGLTALTALAVFVFFGAYWQMVWRQINDEQTRPHQPTNINNVRKPHDFARNHSSHSRICTQDFDSLVHRHGPVSNRSGPHGRGITGTRSRRAQPLLLDPRYIKDGKRKP
jgi:hypothetical protein